MSKVVQILSTEEPAPAYFGDCDSCGDGQSRAYLGRTVDDIVEAIKTWISSGHLPEEITISMLMMTDAEVDALPDM